MDQSDKPMTLDTVKELIDVVKRINDAVEAGKTPRLHNEFERNIYRRSLQWCGLGNGNVHKGFERWAEGIRRQNKQRELNSPAWNLLMEMYESPNPIHRTFAEIIGEQFSYGELNNLVTEILPQEMEKSAQELPGAALLRVTSRQPWETSRPDKRERDKIIWMMREENYTWNQIAEELSARGMRTAISTIKVNYERMKALSMKNITTHAP